MDNLGFLFSKKILIILSGLIFTGVTFSSSGAESLFQGNDITASETKVPEVQNLADEESSPSPAPTLTPNSTQQAPKKSSSPIPTPKPVSPTVSTIVSTTPKPSVTSNLNTIRGLGQSSLQDTVDDEDEDEDSMDDEDEAEDSDNEDIDDAFRRAKDEE